MWWTKIISKVTKRRYDETGVRRVIEHAWTIEKKASWTYLKLKGIKRHFPTVEALENYNCTILESIAFIKNIASTFTEAIAT